MNAQNLLLGLAAVTGLAASASGQIVGSGHDFSSMAWSQGEICLPCHTPHFAITGLPRLWNHELTVATYQLHGGTGTAEDDFDVQSRMCLSCHDGTVALDSFGGRTGSSFITPGKNLGTDLTDDHPVGSQAEYPPDPAPSWWAGAYNPSSSFPSQVRLKNWVNPAGVTRQVVSCMTCHNPHNRGNHDAMLQISNSASGLCLTCHIK
jgi:predicted CXXCH cytochrome family protein